MNLTKAAVNRRSAQEAHPIRSPVPAFLLLGMMLAFPALPSAAQKTENSGIQEVKPNFGNARSVVADYQTFLEQQEEADLIANERIRAMAELQSLENPRSVGFFCSINPFCAKPRPDVDRTQKLRQQLENYQAIDRQYQKSGEIYNTGMISMIDRGEWPLPNQLLQYPNLYQRLPLEISAEGKHVIFRFEKVELPENVTVEILDQGQTIAEYSGTYLKYSNGLSQALTVSNAPEIRLKDNRQERSEILALSDIYRSAIIVDPAVIPPPLQDPHNQSGSGADNNESLCSEKDARIPFQSSIIGQVRWVDLANERQGARGTVFRIDGDYLLSAGHNFPDYKKYYAIEDPLDFFQVWFLPIRYNIVYSRYEPGPEHLFYLDTSSIDCSECFLDNADDGNYTGGPLVTDEPGNDWAVFQLLPNAKTGLTVSETFASDGHFTVARGTAGLTDPTLLVAGFGVSDETRVENKMQVGTGELINTQDPRLGNQQGRLTDAIYHSAQTTNGNSGAPIFLLAKDDVDHFLDGSKIPGSIANAQLAGIHTNGYCHNKQSANEGTSMDSHDLADKLKALGLR